MLIRAVSAVYMREDGGALHLRWGARTLTGQVAGSGSTPYETTVIFPAEVLTGSSSFTSYCSCPVSHNCKRTRCSDAETAIDRSAKAKESAQ